jgi:hypothetical protein
MLILKRALISKHKTHFKSIQEKEINLLWVIKSIYKMLLKKTLKIMYLLFLYNKETFNNISYVKDMLIKIYLI